jgi:hypothetical protein
MSKFFVGALALVVESRDQTCLSDKGPVCHYTLPQNQH